MKVIFIILITYCFGSLGIANAQTNEPWLDKREMLKKDYQSQISIYQSLIPKHPNSWSFKGNCLDYAGLWLDILKPWEASVSLATADTNMAQGSVILKGEKVNAFKTHFFLVDRSFSQEIVIDPTYRQFIEGGDTLSEPPVFIGTRKEAEAFFKKYKTKLRVDVTGGEEFTGMYDPTSFAELIYGYGSNKAIRATF